MKRVVRVPAISMKMADIPPDDYSWRKYGQKPIKGSPHPRYIQSKFSLFFLKLHNFIKKNTSFTSIYIICQFPTKKW